MNKGLKISIIGSGNVACHLARALMHNNRIDAVFSRNIDNARQLAEITGAPAVDTINALPDSSDIYIIAVSDDAIPTISQQLSRKNGVVVHTSGSTPMSILSNNAQHGVFYPFQTFSKHKELNIKTVPFLIEANDIAILRILNRLASSVSDHVVEATSEQRLQLHIAAVFGCNFVNQMYSIANQILSRANLDFGLLHPLIMETAQKACSDSPAKSQTGPAVRGDSGVVNKHLGMLNSDMDLKRIYRILSESISKMHNKELTISEENI